MAKSRLINTRFWDDTYISDLDPIEKLLFLYFLTNPATNICGVYELPLKNVALDTGIEREMVRKILDRFTADRKIFYIDGWVYVTNFAKHQNNKSPLVIKGIKSEYEQVPDIIKAQAEELIKIKGIDTVSHLIKSNLTELNSLVADAPETPIFEREIREKGESYRSLVKDLGAKDYISAAKIHQIALDEFLPYWLERSPGAKKARWEKEKAFDYQRRFRTWIKNVHRSDITCSEGYWHRKGETCHHKPPEIDYKKLLPSDYAKSINKRAYDL